MSCEYVSNYYQVPAEIGRKVTIYGRSGIIAADRGSYIGVNFDDDRPGVICNAHPIDGVEYGEMGRLRNLTESQKRYQRYQEYGDGFESFIEYCYWDAMPERASNQ